MSIFTKLAKDVFAAFTSGGQPRKIDPGEAAVWGTEIESAFDTLDQEVDQRISEAEDLLQAGTKPPLLAVRLLVTTDVDLSTAAEAGDTLDGLVLIAGQRIAKAYNGATGHWTNGIWIVQSSGAAVRATDADTGPELEYATFFVDEGTHAGEQWAVKTGSIPTLGTTPIVIEMVRAAVGYEAEVIAARGTQPVLNDRIDGLQAIASVGLISSDGSVRDYRRNAGISRDLTTSANNIAGAAVDTVGFARNITAYRIDESGSVASVLANVLRVQHDKDGNPLGALVEFSQTNRMLHNRDFTNAAWTRTNVTVTAASTTIRGLSFSKIEATASAATALHQTVAGAGHAAGNTVIWTVAKGSGAGDGHGFLLRNATTAANLRFFRFDYDTGATTDVIGSGGVTATDMGGYWRIVLQWAAGISAGNSLQVYSCFNSSPETAGEYAYLANVQLHDRMLDTSDIDTTTTAVTRPADMISKAVAEMPFAAGRGTVFAEWGPGTVLGETVLVELDDGTVNNRILIGVNQNGTVFGQIVSGGVTQALITTSASHASGGSAYLAWKANDVELVVNGASVGTDDAASIPTVTTYRVGSNYADAQQPNGTIKRDAYYPRRLTTAEMVQEQDDDEEEPPVVIDVDDEGDILTPLAQSSAAKSVFRDTGGVVYEKTVSTMQQVAIIDHQSDTVISDGTANDRFPSIVGNAVRFASDRQDAVLREYRMLSDGKSVVAAGSSNKVYLVLGYGDSTSIGSAFTGATPNQFTTVADFLGAVLGFNSGPRHAGSSQNSGAGGLTNAVAAGDIDRLIPLVAVRDSSAYGETHLEVAAYRLRDECDLRVITANPGVGGAVHANLVKGTVPYANCLAYAERAQEIIGWLGWELEVVVTLNNGTNEPGTDREVYKAFMAQLYADFASDFAAITGQTTFHLFAAQPGVLDQSDVPIAIWEVSKETPNIHCVGPAYELEYIDTAHPSYLGYTEMSDLYFRAMKTVLVDETEWKPLQPLIAIRAAAVIDVMCEGQTGAVQILAVPGHTAVAINHGIEFWDDSGAPPAVDSVTTISGGFRVTLASAPGGGNQVLRGAWTRYGTIPAADAIARTDIADSDTMVATHDGHAMQKRLVNFEIAVTT